MTVHRFPIVRLQVQTEPLKVGRAPLRRYDPTPIESVPRLEISERGVIGLGRGLGRLVDVHHQDHERTRDARGNGGVTVMGTGDYVALRERYGEHLVEGIAGETILVDAPDGLAGLPVPESISVVTAAGSLPLVQVRVADPCVEFARFCLGLEPSPVVGDDIRAALVDLDNGARGYRAAAAPVDGPVVVALGDTVVIDLPD
ncbi:hypothetical protein GIS00_15320 [Nakamurella sp. YIM 132087]|uniref:MOSC domain-containing protein n=1 Tax=Nakamurella alba TaxID=2665158 RepID=A0A7K1FMD3_9ACTN|nr:hypothetical protein [Nakamurella alba]MTD15312.1 hypothetical protein [Nakamurella alba]